MKRTLLTAGLSLTLISLILVSWNWPTFKKNPETEEPSSPPFYFGIPEKPVYSKSIVDTSKSSYEFEPVLQFDLVKHDFIIRNTSKQMLELKSVKACCGTIVESYSRQIPAGKEGVIKTVLLTERHGGQKIQGTITAMTNDPKNPEWNIDISCLVKKFADISEFTIMLDGSWRKPIDGSSIVIPVPEYPFKITSCKAKRGIFIEYGYKEITHNGKKAYLIWAKNTRKEPGVIRDSIYLQTDNPSRPQFMIRVQGKLTD